MKKYISIFLVMVSLFTLCACKSTNRVNNDSTSTPNEQVQQKDDTSLPLKVDQTTNFHPTFSTAWKTSPDDSKEVTIEGRGTNASEEGEAILVVKNKTTNIYTLYSLSDFEEQQTTFKYAEWIDGHRLFLIIGMAYGTVTQGGDLYLLNLENNELSLAMEAGVNEEFVDIRQQRDNNTYYFKKFIHNEDYNGGRYEEGKLTLSSIE